MNGISKQEAAHIAIERAQQEANRWRGRLNRISLLAQQIASHGYSVAFVEWCENADTPGFLGAFGGITDHTKRLVRIKTHDTSAEEIVKVLEHELRHVEDPSWDCGNRDSFGRGAPMPAKPCGFCGAADSETGCKRPDDCDHAASRRRSVA